MMTSTDMELSKEDREKLLQILGERFAKNKDRYKDITWEKILMKLEEHPEKLWSLNEMEKTGGEPSVAYYLEDTDEVVFIDFSKETPKGRRNVCYDGEALASRKEHKPKNSAMDMAMEMAAELLTEEDYRRLQSLGEFDTKTSSWIRTPASIRSLGGALFADRRYNTVFIYHNGAESYYGVRGFRCSLKV